MMLLKSNNIKQNINGILLLDKPQALSSNAALQKVKRLFNAKKAGHTGSLDPLATGMLPLCFGEATKFSHHLLAANKVYEVTAKLGVQTSTGDAEGNIIATRPVHAIPEQIDTILAQFIGDISQIPPMYSALKFQGQPLYQLARKGLEVKRQARIIHIYDIQLLAVAADELNLRVHCSKGTYIRTLVEDIGHALGCGAHVKILRRVSVEPFQNVLMYKLDELEKMTMDSLMACLLATDSAIKTFPAVHLSVEAAFYLRMGQSVQTTIPHDANLFVRLYDENKAFLGLGEILADRRVKPHRLVNITI